MDTQNADGQQDHQTDDWELYHEIDSYPWDQDSEFQMGLSAILGPSPSPSQVEPLTLRARCFYFARMKSLAHPIDFEAYKAWHSSHKGSKIPPEPIPSPPAASLSTPSDSKSDSPPKDENPPYPTSFAALVQLITSGAAIPGIKEIPPTLLASQATLPQANRRRKPWETAGHVIEKVETAGEGTFGDSRDEIVVQDLPVVNDTDDR